LDSPHIHIAMFVGQVFVFCCCLAGSHGLREEKEDKRAKALSIFTVVNFPNIVCTSTTSGRNGTCYTSSECSAKGGSSSGACASGFGVCCIFEKTCGGDALAENVTYFTSSGRSLGSTCSLTVCKCSSDVCQLRLDFETFAINNAVTATTITYGPNNAGVVALNSANSMGECQVDTFQVTTCGSKAPPVICGTNTGEHMYIAACDGCNTMNAFFGSASTAGTGAFTIKVTQIPCNSKTAAPSGCLQYFTGTTGTFSSYNYNSAAGPHLADQHYSACFRAERTICAICYYSTSFKMSVPNGIAVSGTLGVDTFCGNPGLSVLTIGGGYDHIVIPDGQCPSPVSGAVVATVFENDRYCGTAFLCSNAIGTTATGALATVCSMNRPFKISVHTDSIEYVFPATDAEGANLGNTIGFQLGYFMQTTCLTRPTAT